MKAIHKWFEQLADFTQHKYERATLAAEVFSAQPFDTSSLEKPACWRRPSRIPGNQRGAARSS